MNKSNSVVILVVMFILISGCTPTISTPPVLQTPTEKIVTIVDSSATPTSTRTPVPTSLPTSTPTRIPLSEIRLEPLLIQPGDLPAGYDGAQVRDIAPEMFREIPKAANTIYQQFEKNDHVAGGVTVFLFDSQSDIEKALQIILDGMGSTQDFSGIGEKAKLLSLSTAAQGVKIQIAELVFIRCNAVVHIRMANGVTESDITSYAKRLDNRLKTLVCGN